MIDSEQLERHMVKAVDARHDPMARSITNTVTFLANAQLAVGRAGMVLICETRARRVRGAPSVSIWARLFPIYEQTIPARPRRHTSATSPGCCDPVGLGIGSLAPPLVNELKQYKPAIVRGNASGESHRARRPVGSWGQGKLDLSTYVVSRIHRHGRRRPRCRRGARWLAPAGPL